MNTQAALAIIAICTGSKDKNSIDNVSLGCREVIERCYKKTKSGDCFLNYSDCASYACAYVSTSASGKYFYSSKYGMIATKENIDRQNKKP